jgi:carboxyl-terminal processing protease
MDAPGLIIDLRNNGGGYSSLADLMAGRLFAHPFVYGRDYFGARLPQRLWRAVREYQVEPRGRIYTGAVVLLVNSGVASTAETFCVSLVEGRGAKTVGRLTAGSTGRPVVFQLPAGGWARYSTGDFVSSRGLHIEGNGINPDVPVSWSLADFRSGRDPDLAAAVQLLLRGQR